jgi:hypothetical protein
MNFQSLQIVPPRATLAVFALVLIDSMGSGGARIEPDAATPVARAATRSASGAAAEGSPRSEADLELERLKRTQKEEPIIDLFAPPAATPPTVTEAEPSAPSAPPLPFTYLGKTIDGDKLTIFIARGEDHYTIVPGQTIDKVYRVEKITATAVTFRYLPLGTRQTLAIPTPD